MDTDGYITAWIQQWTPDNLELPWEGVPIHPVDGFSAALLYTYLLSLHSAVFKTGNRGARFRSEDPLHNRASVDPIHHYVHQRSTNRRLCYRVCGIFLPTMRPTCDTSKELYQYDKIRTMKTILDSYTGEHLNIVNMRPLRKNSKKSNLPLKIAYSFCFSTDRGSIQGPRRSPISSS